MTFLNRVWDACTAPSEKILKTEERRRARALSSLVFVMLPIGLILVLQFLAENRETLRPVDVMGQMISYACFMGCYVLCRSRFYLLGAGLMCLVIMLGTWAAFWVEQSPVKSTGVMLATAAAILFAGVFTSSRYVIVMATVNIAIGLVMVQLHPHLDFNTLSPAFITLFYLSGLSVFAGVMHQKEIIDISSREASLRRTTERQELALDSLCEGVWELNLQDGKAYYSPQWKTMRGLQGSPALEFIDTWWHSIFPEDVSSVQKEMEQIFERGVRDLQFSFRVKTRSENPKWMRAHVRVIDDGSGNPARLIGAELDETEVVNYRERLTAMVKDKTLALQESLEAEKKMSEQQKRFLANASHELRTPMASILASSDVLRKYRDRMTPDEINARFEKINGQIHLMAKVLDELSELSHMRRGGLILNEFNVSELCAGVVQNVQSLNIKNVNIEMAVEGRDWLIRIDKNILERAFFSVLDNALKYSKNNGTVQVLLKEDADEIIFRVEDHGLGIAQADLEFIYQPFFRGRNVGDLPGAGLGLSIVYNAVTLHDGKIGVQSKEGIGTCVTVAVPRRVDEPS